jgi:hypothetical protein
LIQVGDFFFLVCFVFLDLQLYLVENWNQDFVLLFDDFFVRTDSVQHVEIEIFIDQCLGVKAMIVLGRSNVLGEDYFVG